MRIDFSLAVKDTVAARNGFRCSFPRCDVTTLGPGELPHETISTGIAAHIHSASPRGPRGQATLSDDELAGIANAIWLCANHARIVDANRGREFPPARLQSFKSAHEARIAFEQRGAVAPSFGWLQSLIVEETPIFVANSRLDFARTTVIMGGNASGKTALCEWLAGCDEISFLKRWSPIGHRGARTHVRFEAMNPLPFNWSFRIYEEANIHFEVNCLAVPRLDIPHAFVHAPERPYYPKTPDESVSSYLSRWLRIDVALVHNIVRLLAARGGHHVHNPRIVKNNGREELRVDVDGTVSNLDFESLSHTEQCRVVVEMAVELARFRAERRPTMLLLDCLAGFDRRRFQDYLEFVTSQTQTFQTVVTASSAHDYATILPIDNLHVAQLRGREPNVSIE